MEAAYANHHQRKNASATATSALLRTLLLSRFLFDCLAGSFGRSFSGFACLGFALRWISNNADGFFNDIRIVVIVRGFGILPFATGCHDRSLAMENECSLTAGAAAAKRGGAGKRNEGIRFAFGRRFDEVC